MACPSCGLAWVEGGAGFSPAEFYDATYFNDEREVGYGDYVGSEPVLRREFRATVRFFSRFVPRGKRLLELGAAYGFFLLEAKDEFDCVGVEVSEAASQAARGRGLDVRTGTFDDAMAKAVGPVDAVVMPDVIEHLTDPLDVVGRIHESLAPGGHVMITTGDFGSPFARLTGKRWRLMTPPEHLFFFTETSLRTMLERVGFEVVGVRHPWKVVPVGLILHQIATKLKFPPPPSLGSHLGVPLNLFDAMRVVARKR